MQPIILIPARRAATRLPDKPLAMIGDQPMIVHVWQRAMEAEVGPVVVACDDPEIAWVIERSGGIAVMTNKDHASGSDRIFEALNIADPKKQHDIIINLQGDLPTCEAHLPEQLLIPFDNPEVDIATLATEITDPAEVMRESVVKPVIAFDTERQGRALYFSRCAVPHGSGPYYHHIGIYGYRRSALERFIALPPGVLEQREKLEQLRALEAGMRIDIRLVDAMPLGVDTQEDLDKARELLCP
ncbi:MAG: 3-deoxy-manno-octulosonate cytidylyltransferase [Rickettsiales bacterium]|nr:3-deoxy-manno-octulosonate cytidylyltransferase [Rickettsiales bacterium]